MTDDLPRLIFFAIIATATGWRSLLWRILIALALILAAFGYVTNWRFSLVVPGGDADIGAGIVLYYGLTALAAALLARILSLLARRLGHPRPWSLWIEVVGFFAFPFALDYLLVGG
jgi:hypothetical protein